jgi:hypothetical protein
MGVNTTGRCQDDYDDNGMDLYDDYNDEAMRGSSEDPACKNFRGLDLNELMGGRLFTTNKRLKVDARGECIEVTPRLVKVRPLVFSGKLIFKFAV